MMAIKTVKEGQKDWFAAKKQLHSSLFGHWCASLVGFICRTTPSSFSPKINIPDMCVCVYRPSGHAIFHGTRGICSRVGIQLERCREWSTYPALFRLSPARQSENKNNKIYIWLWWPKKMYIEKEKKEKRMAIRNCTGISIKLSRQEVGIGGKKKKMSPVRRGGQ